MSEITETPVQGSSNSTTTTSKEVRSVDMSSKPTPITPEPTIETPETVVEKDPKEDVKASRFAALSKQEKALREKEQALKAQEQEFTTYKQALEAAKKDPLAYLQAAGLTLEEALNAIIAEEDAAPTPEELKWQRMEDTAKKVEEYEARMAREAEEQQQVQIEQENAKLKSEIMDSLTGFIESNSEKYELIQASNAIPYVWELCERTWNESKGERRLTFAEAADMVENYYETEAKATLEKATKSKKLASMLSLTAPAGNQASKQIIEAVKKVSPTLTNSISTVQSEPPPRLTREESLKRMAAKLKASWDD